MILAVLLALSAAVATAWRLARRRQSYRVTAAVLTLGLAVDVIGELLRPSDVWADLHAAWLPWPSLDALPRPYTGTARVLFHLEQAGGLAWLCAVVVVVVMRVLGQVDDEMSKRDEERTHLRGIAWVYGWTSLVFASSTIAHVIAYPWLRGDRLAMVLRIEQALAVAVMVACAVAWASARTDTVHGRRQDSGRQPEHAAAIALVIAEVHVLLFSFTGSPFDLWEPAQIAYTAAFGWLAVMQVRWTRCMTR